MLESLPDSRPIGDGSNRIDQFMRNRARIGHCAGRWDRGVRSRKAKKSQRRGDVVHEDSFV
jgi:hypothetical protein